MPSFGKKSLERLAELDTKLQDILLEAIQIMDFSIICGQRGELEQNTAFNEGKSKLQFPNSKHNQSPSLAVDIAPYKAGIGIDWNDINSFERLCGIIEGIALMKDIKVRMGRDFKSFKDYPHFELVID